MPGRFEGSFSSVSSKGALERITGAVLISMTLSVNQDGSDGVKAMSSALTSMKVARG